MANNALGDRLPNGVFMKNGIEVRKCKQCHRTLSVKSFRRNVPRGKGTYNTLVGYHTICIECEAVENLSMRLYKKSQEALERGVEVDKDTQDQINDVIMHYKVVESHGYPLITKYARLLVDPNSARYPSKDKRVTLHFLSEGVAVHRETTVNPADLIKDELSTELYRMLTMELSDIPDVYQDMLSSIRVKISIDPSVGDSKVKLTYKELYDKVLNRFDCYEDDYAWPEED